MANYSTSPLVPPFWSRVSSDYTYLMVDLRDPRTDTYPLMSSVWPTVLMCLAYVYIVKFAGPRFMKNRPPYEIKTIIVGYNLFQTLFSLWGFIQGWKFFVTGHYSWTCQPIDYSDDPEALRALNMAWLFYISKFIDMFDSFFFVLKKKFTHLSFLHVYHHGIMPFECWFGARFVGGGHSGFLAFLNAGVHTVMYLYYLLAACGPKVQKYLWWKRYLTRMQMLQFICVFIHALLPTYFDCGYPNIMPKVIIANATIFFVLFANFYFFAYINNNNKKTPLNDKND